MYESVVLICVGSGISENEMFLVKELCNLFKLEEDFIEEFKDLGTELTMLYKKVFEIITE